MIKENKRNYAIVHLHTTLREWFSKSSLNLMRLRLQAITKKCWSKIEFENSFNYMSNMSGYTSLHFLLKIENSLLKLRKR